MAAIKLHGNPAQAADGPTDAELHDYLAASADWLWEADPELRFTALTSVPSTDPAPWEGAFVGHTPRELADDLDAQQKWRELADKVVARQPFREFMFERRDRKATPRHLLLSGVPVRDERGQPAGWRGTLSDATHLAGRQAAVLEAEERLRDYALISSDWFWEMGPDLRFTWVSDRVEAVTGVPAAFHIGKSREELAGDHVESPEWKEHLADLRARKPFRNFQYWRVGPKGERQFMSTSGTPFYRNGQFGGYRGIGVDLTEQKLGQEALELSNAQIRQDLNLASEFQRAMLELPQTPHFLEVAGIFEPHSAVSGDVYVSYVTRDGDYSFFIGDGTGHGVAAAFLTVMVQLQLAMLPADLPPAEILAKVNQALSRMELAGKFISGLLFRVSRSGTLHASSAGHQPLIVLPADGSAPVKLEAGGFPLGWFGGESRYEADWRTLQPGDTLLAYTDGLTEWSNAGGQQFGLERLLTAANKFRNENPDSLVNSIVMDVRDFSRFRPCQDDLTLFAFRFLGE